MRALFKKAEDDMHLAATSVTSNSIVQVMRAAARQAGMHMAEVFSDQAYYRLLGLSSSEILEKRSAQGETDLLGNCNQVVEKIMRHALGLHCQRIDVIEKSGQDLTAVDDGFLIDSCNGHQNFISGVPYFAVSIAQISKGEPVAAVICDPIEQKIYWTEKWKGAFREDMKFGFQEELHVHREDSLKNAILVIERPDEISGAQKQPVEDTIFISRFSGTRSFGSTALTFARMATGLPFVVAALDTNPWNFAAGHLIANEAGAVFTDIDGSPSTFRSKNVLCSTARQSPLLFKIG